jgi:hypothetical protein
MIRDYTWDQIIDELVLEELRIRGTIRIDEPWLPASWRTALTRLYANKQIKHSAKPEGGYEL